MNLAKTMLTFLTCFVLAITGQAEDNGATNTSPNSAVVAVPVGSEILKNGYAKFPVVQCPTQKKKYEDMLMQIETLKNAVAANDKCADERAKVEKLADLLGDKRDKFWELFNKGRSASLTEKESLELQGYIDAVVQKSASVIDVINSSFSNWFYQGCFSEEKKETSLQLIANVLNEVSGAVGTISGPYGAAISLAGKITAGLFSSLDKVLESNGYYHFNDEENRRKFAKNLCTYYSFKSDLDEVTKPQVKVRKLEELVVAAEKHLEVIAKGCENCDQIIAKFEVAADSENFSLRPWRELESINAIEVAKADASFEQKLGQYTVLTLTTQQWAKSEIQRIRDQTFADTGDLARDKLMERQQEIENYFVKKYGPLFIGSLIQVMNARSYEFRQSLLWDWAEFKSGRRQPDPVYNEGRKYHYEVYNIIDFLYQPNFADILVQPDDLAKMESFRANIDHNLTALASAYGSVVRYCHFFRYANFGYLGEIPEYCEGYRAGAKKAVEKIFQKIAETNYPKEAMLFDVFKPVTTPFTRTWYESLTAVLNDMTTQDEGAEGYLLRAKGF